MIGSEEYVLSERTPRSNGCVDFAKVGCLCCLVTAIAGATVITGGVVYLLQSKRNDVAPVQSQRYK